MSWLAYIEGVEKMRICLGLVALGFFIQAAFSHPIPLDGVAATVNDSIITKSELAQQVNLIERQQLRQGVELPPDPLLLERQVLEHLILNEIQLQLAKKTGITIDELAVDNAIENIATQNNVTVTQLREMLSKEDIDFEHYRTHIRHQMTLSQLQQRDISGDINVSEQEVIQFLQSPHGPGGLTTEYRLKHILIPLPEAPSSETLQAANQKAMQIVTALREGQDFAEVAFKESTGEQALNGGDLGWRKLPEIPTIFIKMVPTLKIKDIPDPIRSPSGLHVIQLSDKRNTAPSQPAIQKTLVRHILIKTNAVTSDEEARRRLVELKQRILSGETFAELAKTHSADLGSASNGGELGWISKEVLVPEFSAQMEQLPLKKISEPFKTSFGWHIMEVLDRKLQNDDEAMMRQKAKEMIHQRKFEEKLQIWARQLRDEAFVKTYYEL